MSGNAAAEVHGRCLCGACTYTGRAVDGQMSVCHCETCRRWAGGALFSVDLGPQIDVAAGSPLLVYASSPHMDRVCCGRCAAPLYRYARNLDRYYGVVQALDDPGQFVFDFQIFTDEKPANYDFANETVMMTGAQAMAALAEMAGKD